MVFDVYAGLSDEYRAYRVIQPEQLPFRQPATDAERLTSTNFSEDNRKNAKTLMIIGAVMVVLGILVLFQSLGGIALIVFGLLPGALGFMMLNKGKAPSLVASGVLVKKDSHQTGTIHSHTQNTSYWLVIAVDDMEQTLCTVRASSEDFSAARVGDRILVTKNSATYRGKPMR